MAAHFGVIWDNETERLGKHFVCTQYFEDRVDVKVCLAVSASSLFADNTFAILDCGYALLQHCTKDNLLFLSFFARSKRSDAEPDIVIRVGVIAAMECAQATLKNGSMEMGQIVVTTHATVDYHLTLGPMKVTIFMSFSGMQSLKMRCLLQPKHSLINIPRP
ncbi:hypothetical protein ACA910_001544 [Epithemia clementina (nom. ined.)]